MLVCGVVVGDQVHIKVLWRLGFDAAQEPEPFLKAMSLHTLADHSCRWRKIECCEQRRCPVAFVVVRHGAASAFLDRQAGLRTVQRLDLAFFVDREHQCLVRRVEVEADNILYLLDEAFDSSKAFTRCGLSSWAFQMRCTKPNLPPSPDPQETARCRSPLHATRVARRCVLGKSFVRVGTLADAPHSGLWHAAFSVTMPCRRSFAEEICSKFFGALRICFAALAGTASIDGGEFGCGPPGPPRAIAS